MDLIALKNCKIIPMEIDVESVRSSFCIFSALALYVELNKR